MVAEREFTDDGVAVKVAVDVFVAVIVLVMLRVVDDEGETGLVN